MVDEQQEQQHETVTTKTTTTTTGRNLHKLLSGGELIFQIDFRSDGPPVVVAVTVSCCCCPAIVIVYVKLQMNHKNSKNSTQ